MSNLDTALLKRLNQVIQRLSDETREGILFDMYEILRSTSERIRCLFDKTNFTHQVRMFRHILEILPITLDPDNPHLMDRLAELGKRHTEFGVLPEDYPLIQYSLLLAMAKSLQFNREELEDWNQLLRFLSEALLRDVDVVIQ